MELENASDFTILATCKITANFLTKPAYMNMPLYEDSLLQTKEKILSLCDKNAYNVNKFSFKIDFFGIWMNLNALENFQLYVTILLMEKKELHIKISGINQGRNTKIVYI